MHSTNKNLQIIKPLSVFHCTEASVTRDQLLSILIVQFITLDESIFHTEQPAIPESIVSGYFR